MKIIVARSEFADALAWASQSVATNPTLPTLAGILLDVVGDQMTVVGTTFESTTKRRISLVSSEEDGKILVQSSIVEIARALGGTQVELSVANNRATIVSGSSRFVIPTIDQSDYPTIGEAGGATGTIPGVELQQVINQVAFAASTDVGLPIINAVNVTIDGNHGYMVATDRYRLAARRFAVVGAAPGTSVQTLLNRTDLVNVSRGLGKAETIHLRMTPDGNSSRVAFGAGQSSLTTTPVNGEYPAWKTLFPSDFQNEITFDSATVTEAVKRVALVLTPKDPIKLIVKAGETTGVLQGGTSGTDAFATEEIAVDYNGEDLELGLNPKFFTEGINAIGEEKVTLKANASTRPLVLQGASDTDDLYRYLLMPVRLQD